jgi:hypothetical protein
MNPETKLSRRGFLNLYGKKVVDQLPKPMQRASHVMESERTLSSGEFRYYQDPETGTFYLGSRLLNEEMWKAQLEKLLGKPVVLRSEIAPSGDDVTLQGFLCCSAALAIASFMVLYGFILD